MELALRVATLRHVCRRSGVALTSVLHSRHCQRQLRPQSALRLPFLPFHMQMSTAVVEGVSRQEDGDASVTASEDSVVRLVGIEYSATEADIVAFLNEADVQPKTIWMTKYRKGQPSGIAYVQLHRYGDVAKAMTKDRHHMGSRYVNIWPASLDDVRQLDISEDQQVPVEKFMPPTTHMATIRNIPFTVTKADVVEWVESTFGVQPVHARILVHRSGMLVGSAEVYFETEADLERALAAKALTMKHRFVYVIRGQSRSQRVENGQQTDVEARQLFAVNMTGLPIGTSKQDIIEWFKCIADPVKVRLVRSFSNEGRFAVVHFRSEFDMHAAMGRHMHLMDESRIRLNIVNANSKRRRRLSG